MIRYGSLVQSTVDRDVLAEALLPLAKDQMRIRHAVEDTDIQARIVRAIAWVESNADLSINPCTWLWTLRQYDYSAMWRWGAPYQWSVDRMVPVPRRPVGSITAQDSGGTTVPDTDITKTVHQDVTGISNTAFSLPADLVYPVTYTLACGYDSLEDVPPLVVDAILRYTAHLYENREAFINVTLVEAPDFAASVLGPLWSPRV